MMSLPGWIAPRCLGKSARRSGLRQTGDIMDCPSAVKQSADQPDSAASGTWPLRVAGLCKSYRGAAALRGVSLDLGPGERLALLGPNGAGKTTLIRCIAGRTRPDGGRIELLGQALTTPGSRHALGLVPQELALYPDLTARENLLAWGRFHGLRGQRLKQRVSWALDWTGLAARAVDLVRGFSGGMQRRVNLACGVLHAPTVLLLDEPTVGVDPQSRQRIFEMLDQLRDAGTAILLTTHHLDEAQQHCDRIVIVDHGRVIAAGSLDELVAATVGSAGQVRLRIARSGGTPPAATEALLPTVGVPATATLTQHGDRLQGRLADVAEQLPLLLQQLRRAGVRVIHTEVRAPSLHDVFLHLTGKQLRD